jgi:hypothetical protein
MPVVKSTDSFGTFLNSMNDRGTLRESSTEPAQIFRVLKTSGGKASIPVLLEASRLPIIELAESLKMLRQAGLVEMLGVEGREEVVLTDIGAQLSSLTEV